ncbi:MAG: P-type conjugative transfer protein TrbJ [Devosia sp.]
MRNMQRRIAVLLCVMMVWSQPANSFFGVGDVVTDPGLTMKTMAAEVARYGQAAQSLQNQVNLYSNAIQNTLSLRDTAFAPLGNMIRSLNSVYMQGQSLMYRAQNLDQQFGSMYPSYTSYQSKMYSMGQGGPTMSSLYQQWSDQGNENIRTALRGAGIQVNDIESDEAMLQRLLDRSATAGGQKAALQAANEIATFNGQQALRARALMGTMIEMQANHIAQQNARISFDDAMTQQYRAVPVGKSQAMEF